MKRFALALVAAAAVSGAHAEMGTGLYLGVNGAMNAFAADARVISNSYIGTQKFNLGRHHAGAGLYVGYGISSGCMFYAGEIGYQFANASMNFDSSSLGLAASFEHKNKFNFAFRMGYKFTPATIGYVRLGGDWGKFKLRTNYPSLSDSKSRLSFAPGLGMETAFGRNWVGRLEWAYGLTKEYKRSLTTIGVKLDSIHMNSTKLGIAYKF